MICDFLEGDQNHWARQCGAGVAALPPPALRKPFTHHAKAPAAHRACPRDAKRSHSRSLLMCCVRSLEALSMAAGGRGARLKVLFNFREGQGQAVGGAGGGRAAFSRSSRGRIWLS